MKKDADLREELIKQMNGTAGRGPSAPQNAAQAILAREATRLKRANRVAVFSWLLLAAAFLASGVTGTLSGFRSELWIICSIIGLQALLIIAVALTIAVSFRSRTLKMKEIQAALADIQDQLKAMSQPPHS
jgi:hypothetical protein